MLRHDKILRRQRRRQLKQLLRQEHWRWAGDRDPLNVLRQAQDKFFAEEPLWQTKRLKARARRESKMRRREINRLRAAGKIPPIDAVGRERWEREQKLARELAEQKLLEAQLDELEGAIQHGSRQTADLAAVKSPQEITAPNLRTPEIVTPISPIATWLRTCPYCGRVCKHPQALKWHLRGCKLVPPPGAPRPAA